MAYPARLLIDSVNGYLNHGLVSAESARAEGSGFLLGAFGDAFSTSRKVLDIRNGIIANSAGPIEHAFPYVAGMPVIVH